MKIQIFGHSIASGMHGVSDPVKKFKTWSDTLLEKYNSIDFCNRNMSSTIMPSEERHLMNLKKVWHLIDLAIIFHGHPRFIYMPSCTRDWVTEKTYDIEKDVYYGLTTGMTITPYGEPTLTDISVPELTQIIETNNRFFYTPELTMLRFYGALIQIDQFCTAMKVPVIHCVLDKKFIPNWFKFSSGIIDTYLSSFQRHHLDLDDGTSIDNPYLSSYNQSYNSINEEGNKIIFDTLDSYIQTMLEKKQIRLR